jgi:serine/threonine-protein kinase
MPSAMYGYMNTSSACAEGTIKFEVFGEKRQTVLPLKQNFGVALPLHMDEKNKPGPQKYMVEYIKNGETEGRKIEITVSREDQSIDLCEIL